jgi:cell division protein ZipA
MDISLREWLIIGGILVVVLILIDGWRRVSANRNRLRLEIDRTLAGGGEPDSPQHNPELPNGGARRRAPDATHSPAATGPERREPVFNEPVTAPEPARQPAAGGPETAPLREMDPLFDDIPSAGEGGARREHPAGAPHEHDEVDFQQPIPILFDAVPPAEPTAEPLEEYKRSRQARPETTDPQPVADDPLPVGGAAGAPERRAAAGSRTPPGAPEKQPAPAADTAPEARAPSTPARPRPGLRTTPDPEHVLVITVVGRNGNLLPGPALDKIVTACGMEWGDMSIYHRRETEAADAPVQFSMANAVAPGTFDPAHLETLQTPAVSFFMSMSEPDDPMNAYECMLATAETVAKHLDGELLDEDRSVMRPQTKEHYRERIREFQMHNRVQWAH